MIPRPSLLVCQLALELKITPSHTPPFPFFPPMIRWCSYIHMQHSCRRRLLCIQPSVRYQIPPSRRGSGLSDPCCPVDVPVVSHALLFAIVLLRVCLVAVLLSFVLHPVVLCFKESVAAFRSRCCQYACLPFHEDGVCVLCLFFCLFLCLSVCVFFLSDLKHLNLTEVRVHQLRHVASWRVNFKLFPVVCGQSSRVVLMQESCI